MLSFLEHVDFILRQRAAVSNPDLWFVSGKWKPIISAHIVARKCRKTFPLEHVLPLFVYKDI